MKGVIRLAGCAVCAIVMSVGCWVAGQQFKVSEAEVMFRDAQRHLAEEQTPEVFAAHYGKLLAKGFSGRARSLAVLYWWLVEDPAVKADIFSDEAWMRGIFPLRVGGPVTNLTIVSIEVCTNAIKFRAEWPLTLSIPCGWLELRAKLGLTEEEWDFLACVIVDPGEGYVEFELPFEEDSILWYYMDEVFAPMAFFKLTVHDPEGWLWPEGGGDVGEDDPPEIIPPVFLVDDHNGVTVFASKGQTVTESVPVVPGCQYLVEVRCFTAEFYPWVPFPPSTPQNYDLSWEITGPNGQSFSGSTDVNTLGEDLDEFGLGYDHHLRVFRIPLPEESSSGSSTTSESIAVSLTVGDHSASTSTSTVQARIKPILLNQFNMPTNAVQKVPGSTDFGVYLPHHTNIVEKGTAFITAEPAPPSLWVSVAGNSFGGLVTVAYRLEIESERSEYRGGKKNKKVDYRDLPGNGAYTPYVAGVNYDLTGDLMNNEIIGGKCTLHYKIKSDRSPDEETGSYTFYIRGTNPPDAAVTNYLHNLIISSPALGISFSEIMRAITWHESRSGGYRWNQYNHHKDTLKFLPFKGKDNGAKKNWGWGICQIDWSGHDPFAYPPTAALYDWKMNCYLGVTTLRDKKNAHLDQMAKIRKYYGSMEEWEEPPTQHPTLPFTTEEFCTIVLYNSAKGCPPIQIGWKKNDKGKLVPDYVFSPLIFNPKAEAGKRWTFHDNRNEYAALVADAINEMNTTKPKE